MVVFVDAPIDEDDADAEAADEDDEEHEDELESGERSMEDESIDAGGDACFPCCCCC